MAATCAVCLTPIMKPEKFVLSGTEVFHARCVVAYGTTNSVVNKQRQQAADLRAQIERLRYELEHEKQRADHERTVAQRIAGERERMGNDLGVALSDARSWRVRMEEARRERDEAVAARDASRREALLHQTIQGTPVAPAVAATPEPVKDERDSTEVRFSLLELD